LAELAMNSIIRLVFALVLSSPVSGIGWCPIPAAAQAPISLSDLKVTAVSPTEAGLGDMLVFTVDQLDEWVDAGNDYRQLILYMEGRPYIGLTPVSRQADQVSFELARQDDDQQSKEAWIALLGAPEGFTRKIAVGVGLANGVKLSSIDSLDEVDLQIVDQAWFWGASLLLAGVLGLFLWLAGRTDIIRDSSPLEPLDPGRRPYSLARFQMAWWFFLVIGPYLFIALVTGDLDTITEQVLVLVGIATGTALGAAMIDSSKAGSAREELARLEPQRARLVQQIAQETARIAALEAQPSRTTDEATELGNLKVALAEHQGQRDVLAEQIDAAERLKHEPVSRGLLGDLVNDRNGISFHRFQILVWTLALGFLFVIEVYQRLSMPEFSTNLLALMGISSGTYLGFKIPERQT
jgi:hypothetical protein